VFSSVEEGEDLGMDRRGAGRTFVVRVDRTHVAGPRYILPDSDIAPHVGSISIERLRPVDVQQLHSQLRTAGLSEGSIGRVHDILRAALNWAERLDLVVRNPAAKVERPRGAKPDITRRRRPTSSA
jgi:hypothetical protein